MTFLKKYGSEILEAVLIFVLLFMFFYPAQVEGKSMEDTLYDGDIIMISRAMAFAGLYDKGDMVVFKYNDENNNEIQVIKTIAASEGDIVESRDGVLYINGEEKSGYICDEDFSVAVGEGLYFVIGDNAQESTDSRYFGLIPKENIKARAVIKLWPINELKSLL